MIALSSDVIVSLSGHCHISCEYSGDFACYWYLNRQSYMSVTWFVFLSVSRIAENFVYEFV